MRLGPGVPLIVVLLFTSVTTASAEGIWILWEQDAQRRLAAFNTGAECHVAAVREAQLRYAAELKSGRYRSETDAVQLHGAEVWLPVEFEWKIITYECLRDTVDPRGPREK